MVIPERKRKIQLFRLIFLSPFCSPVIKTISHAMTRTTTVRIAVPRLDSTCSTPIFPNMEVRLANTAESTAKSSHCLLSGWLFSTSCFEIIRRVPIPMPSMPMIWGKETGSPKNRNASRMVSTVLDLSMGATLFTSPS